ncbi:MAG TPA: quaternary ammonium compound efflux SMR transporter SugE [Chthoniobacteraceae bacterium]|nr:quaternary ammonium compound efflux SMR transporter SugE [Chthoniobacteraceae bacterium]
MAWTLLLLAALFEIGWAIGLKYTDGFSKLWPTVGTITAMVVSMGLLGLSVRTLPVGTAYAVWTGIGAVGTVLIGIMLLGESASAARLVCVSLILCGVIGLKIFSPA